MSLLVDRQIPGRQNPIWYRIPVWGVLTGYSVTQAHGVTAQIATGALMVASIVAIQLVGSGPRRVNQLLVVFSIAAGIAACLLAHRGLAEIPVVIASGQIPVAFRKRALWWFTAVDAVAFGVTIAVITQSASGLLAGLAVPFLVQRALEHQELVFERDRARALLAEVQRGRESEAQAAALEERSRIAREMHDVLAHSLAGLSVQLQAIRTVAAREHADQTLLDPIDKAALLARDGLAEARAAVSTLRDPAGLGLDSIAALVERHPGTARLELDGEPGEVGPQAGHAVYRAVQESLTNAARYAPGSRVDVGLEWRAAELLVTVSDTGPAPGRAAVTGQGTGLGLAGMTERLHQVGGWVRSGPDPDHLGWRVEIRVPTGTGVAT